MALDANIILRGQPVQLDSPMEVAQKAMTLKQMTNQVQAQEQDAANKRRLSDIMKANVVTDEKGNASLNRQATLSEMFKENPQAAIDYEKIFADQDLNKMKAIGEKAKQLAWSATPENWGQIRQSAIQQGLPNADKLPEVYMPSFVERWQMGTLEGEKQLEMRMKQQTHKLAEDRLAFDREKSIADRIKSSGEIKQNQALAAGFGRRLEQAENAFKEIKDQGYNRQGIGEAIDSAMPNIVKSGKGQQQEQAERNFVNAVLRRESGAAISPAEFESAEKQYFPRAGDSKETLAQKAANRSQQMAMFKAEAGRAWEAIPLVKPKNESAPSILKTSEIEWAD